jgi:hypothetical protein
MGSYTRSVIGFSTLALVLVSGCQKLKAEGEVSLGPGDVLIKVVEGPKSNQKVKVDVNASAPVDVYLVLLKEPDVEDKLVNKNKLPDQEYTLAQEKQVETTTLEGTVPAKTNFGVLFRGAKKSATVKYKMAGS